MILIWPIKGTALPETRRSASAQRREREWRGTHHTGLRFVRNTRTGRPILEGLLLEVQNCLRCLQPLHYEVLIPQIGPEQPDGGHAVWVLSAADASATSLRAGRRSSAGSALSWGCLGPKISCCAVKQAEGNLENCQEHPRQDGISPVAAPRGGVGPRQPVFVLRDVAFIAIAAR